MSQLPDYSTISVALSEVLNELGLNEEIVNQRRRTFTLKETVTNLGFRLIIGNYGVYYFGSQIEGTTTTDLKSDVDRLTSMNDYNVIEDWRLWKADVINLLMVSNQTTAPGYCLLQSLRSDVPLPETRIIDQHHIRDDQGRILLKTTCLTSFSLQNYELHGPAISRSFHARPVDLVPALSCDSLLEPVRQWLSQAGRPWPTDEMKTYIANSPCFIVPVGSRRSYNAELEWRISSSLAERCLMLNMNITQLQVYVLMKMLLKTRVNCNVPDEHHISSFMCKTVLLHSIQKTDHHIWRSDRLIECLLYCLSDLYDCVMNESCPHFIMSSNNLMAGRFTLDSKRQLHENFQLTFQEFFFNGILSLHFDNVANRLVTKLSLMRSGLRCLQDDEECQNINADLFLLWSSAVCRWFIEILSSMKCRELNDQIALLQRHISVLQQVDRNGDFTERSACRLLAPLFCTTLGSLMASRSIQDSGRISPESLTYFSLGLNSDVTSTRLKLASVLYMSGDLNRAEIILRDVDNRYDFNVCEPFCACSIIRRELSPSRTEAMSVYTNRYAISNVMASCVIFMPTEGPFIPRELKYEMYRSTPDDMTYRGRHDNWMDWAVMDSVPFLQFLQYTIYSRLQRPADKQRALDNLMMIIPREPNLGHKETILNVLGQCLEQEHRWNDALQCYSRSLSIRLRNNAAKFHVCRLIYTCLSLRN